MKRERQTTLTSANRNSIYFFKCSPWSSRIFWQLTAIKICLFLSLTALHAQTYTPLLDTTNEWQFTNCYFGCLTDIYYTDGDTLVAGQNYKILDGYHYISRTFLLREEITTKRVYLRKLGAVGIGQEYLLYDFDLEEGDSIDMRNPITPFPENAGFFDLDSIIPRILEDGEPYNHYYFSPSDSNEISDNNCVWIEGVGSLSIINAPSGLPDINGAGHLSCFFKQGNLFYTNLDSISGCSSTLGFHSVIKPISAELLVNRDSQTLTIRARSTFDQLEVYNLHGQQLVYHKGLPSTEITLPINTTNGVYFVRIQNRETQQSKVLSFIW